MSKAHIFFSGIVQGVGFRYTVKRHADQLGLVGWVQNLSDGRVEAMIQGEKNIIQKLCQNVEDHFEGHIRNCEVDFQESDDNFQDFQIK